MFPMLAFVCLIDIGYAKPARQETERNDNISNTPFSVKDSISLQIKTYEGILDELQQRPVENKSMASLLTQLGNLYFKSENYPKAIDAYIKSIVLREYNQFRNESRSTDVAWIMIEVGNSLYRLHDFGLAEYVYTMALRVFATQADEPGIITTCNNIGLCKLNAGHPKQALPVFLKTLEISKKNPVLNYRYVSTIYVGMSYNAIGDYKNAISMFRTLNGIDLGKDEEDLRNFMLIQLGDTYFNAGENDSAVSVYRKLVFSETGLVDSYYKTNAATRLARFYLDEGNDAEAMKLALEAERTLKFVEMTSVQNTVNELLYELYKKQGDYRKALAYLELYEKGQELVNQRELQTFVADYNRKLDRISMGLEFSKIQAQRNQALSEKQHQKTLSVFLVALAFLLLIMLLTGKGFESRIQLLQEHIKSYATYEKAIMAFLLAIYFIAFFFFFMPSGKSFSFHDSGFIKRIVPGMMAYVIVGFFSFIFYGIRSTRSKEHSNYNYYIYLFISAYIGAVTALVLLVFASGELSFNVILSIALAVLASFIFPFYLFLLVVENLVIKHYESMSQTLNNDIDQIKQIYTPQQKTVTIQSEKTTGKLTFFVADLVAVEAQGNYCMFYLSENGSVSKKILHTTMKSLEEQLAEFSNIIRCHKSFMINIHQISKVSGNSRGYLLHFSEDTESIPVSRGYQKEVMSLVRSFRDGIS